MESVYWSVLSSKGQLTVPKPLRKRLKLEEGQPLVLEENGTGLLVKKAAIREAEGPLEEEEWEELKRLASQKGKIYESGKAFLRSLKSK